MGTKFLFFWSILTTAVFVNSDKVSTGEFKKSIWRITADLYKETSKYHSGNMLFSPFNIASGLAMLLEGASEEVKQEIGNITGLTNGTREQFSHVMKSFKNNKGADSLDILNSIWIPLKEKMTQSFHRTVKNRYFADTRAANFTQPELVAKVVNKRISDFTNGNIEDLLSPDIMGPDTELLLVNALYFKGKWQYTFEKEDTIEANFTDSAGEIMKVNMMRSNLTISAGHACCGVKAKVAVLPYNQDEVFNLAIIVPDDPLGYTEVEDALVKDPEILPKIINRLSTKDIEFALPRFEMETEIGLKDVLKDIGLNSLFTKSLSNIVYKKQVKVSSAVHKAKLQVNEEGTEAAAASAFVVTPLMADFDKTREIIADHTFIFVLWDSSNDIPLFMGRVSNPTPSSSAAARGETEEAAKAVEEDKETKRVKRQVLSSKLSRRISSLSSAARATTHSSVENVDTRKVTGPANWWKPTPDPSVLIDIPAPQALEQSAFAGPAESVKDGGAIPQFAKWPQKPQGPQGLESVSNNQGFSQGQFPIFNQPLNFFQNRWPQRPFFVGPTGNFRPNGQYGQGLINFQGLAVRVPENISDLQRETVPVIVQKPDEMEATGKKN